MAQKEKNIVINCYNESDGECEGPYEGVADDLKVFLKDEGYGVDKYVVDTDKGRIGNLVSEIEKADHTISVVTKTSIDKFFKEEDHYQVWLRALHKALEKDNLLTHIIFCVDVDVEKVTWYLRQFNPCVTYSSENNDWKEKLRDVLKLEKKSVKTLKHVNVGEALAWSHHTGYISFLPNIDADGDPKDECVWRSKDGRPVINEMVMLVPKDCHCPDKIEHKLIKGPLDSERYTFHRAGKERKLNVDLYEIEGIEKLVPISCTTSIETLRLLKENNKDLDKKWLQEQRQRYIDVLKEIIEKDQYLRRKVILIDNYNSSSSADVKEEDDLVKVILARLEACQEQNRTEQKVKAKCPHKPYKVYIRSNELDDELAEDIKRTLQTAIPTLKIMDRHGRKYAELSHSESCAKIDEADQCIFLLTKHNEEISTENEISVCLEKIVEFDNKRATILLYTKKAKDVHKHFFQLLAKHFVAKVQHGKAGWENKLSDRITDIQARPLQSAVNFHNISEGLAFGYLYGYLNIFLPAFSKKMMELKNKKEVSDMMPKKIIILMPKSGYSPKSLQAPDDNDLKSMKELKDDERKIGKIRVRVACQERDYSVTEYSLKDEEDGKEYFVAAEFLTPLQTLTEMWEDIFADMSNRQKRERQRNLRKVMLEIKISKMIPEDLVDKFILLEVEDEHFDEKGKPTMNRTDPEKLELYHQELLKTVKEELKRESEDPVEPVTEQLSTTDIK